MVWGERGVPVDGGDDAALCEGGGGLALPEAVVRAVAFVGLVEGVVERRDEQDQVRQARGDLVEEDRLARELLAARKRVAAAA